VQNCFVKTLINSLLLVLCSHTSKKEEYLRLMKSRLVVLFLTRYLGQFESCPLVHQYIISHLSCSHVSTVALKSLDESPQVDAVIISPEGSEPATELYKKINEKLIDVSSIYSRKYDYEDVGIRFANSIIMDMDEDVEDQARGRGRSDAHLQLSNSQTSSKHLEGKKKSIEWIDISAEGEKSYVSIESDEPKDPPKPSEEKKNYGFFDSICSRQ